MYSSIQIGFPDLIDLDGDEDEVEAAEFLLEFLFFELIAASLQKSTHLGVRASRLLLDALDDEVEDEEEHDEDASLCFLTGGGVENSDLLWKKSCKSNPQINIRSSSIKKIGFPAMEGLQGM